MLTGVGAWGHSYKHWLPWSFSAVATSLNAYYWQVVKTKGFIKILYSLVNSLAL